MKFIISLCAVCICHRAFVQAAVRGDPEVIPLPNNLNQIGSSEEIKITEVKRRISILGDQFMLDGSPLHIISGSLHYFRVPAAYWRDRLRKLKAAGLNSVSTYVEWSFHEPEERQYNFEGDRDVAQFIRTAAEEGLLVLLRPGPYICAERDLGGLPYWLLGKYPNIKLRSTDTNFIDESKTWMNKLFSQLNALLYGNGGPVILVQVENEYGSYGNDKVYLEQLRDILSSHVSTNAILYTTDGASPYFYRRGSVSDTLTTIDFGPGSDVVKNYMDLRKYMPHGPLMNSEYYPGWLTHWGEPMANVSTKSVVKTFNDMLANNISVNFYMFFGGSNFEFTAGANYGGTYQSDITSYDYDAPLTEAGDPTPKYYAIKDTIDEKYPDLNRIPVPPPSPKGAYGTITLNPKIQLLTEEGRSSLGKKYSDVTGAILPTFEELRQRAGFVLYETTLNADEGLLYIGKPRDIIYIAVDGEFKGVINRIAKIYSLPITAKSGSKLSLLVENQGRINFGSHLHDRKGILSTVKFNNNVLSGKWSVTGFPLESLKGIENTTLNIDSNILRNIYDVVLYDGYLTLPEHEQPKDTFVDTTGWGKGYIWINGHNLGRYWPGAGPQITLYVPGIWLLPNPERNHVQVLELKMANSNCSMEFIDHPILDRNGLHNLYSTANSKKSENLH